MSLPRAWPLRVVAAVLALLACGCAPGPLPPEVSEVTRAQLITADVAQPPPDSAAGWRAVTLPDLWSERRPEYQGSAWYRFELPPAGGTHQRWAIYLPRLSMNAAVYLNGKWIGDGGSFELPVARNWNRPLYFPISPELLSRERNVVHVRVFAYAHDWGGLWPVQVGPHELLQPRYEARYFRQVTVAELAAVFMLVMMLFVGAVWLVRRRETVYLFFVAAGAAFLLHNGSAHLRDAYVPHHIGRWLVHAAIDCYGVFMVLGVHRWAGVHRPHVERALWAYAIVGSAASLLAPAEWFLLAANASHIGALVVAYYGISVVLRRFRELPGPEALIVAAGSAFVVAVGTHAVLVQLGVLDRDSPRLLKLMAPVVSMGFGAVLVARFVRAARRAEALNRELEPRVAEKERELRAGFERIGKLEAERAVTVERERIMREMHDGVGGQLCSTLALVEAGTTDAAVVGRALEDALQEMRLMIDSAGLVSDEIPTVLGMLRTRLEPRVQQQGLRFRWRVGDVPTPPELGKEGLLHVTRIVQEAITNVIKHARAETITVAAEHDGERVLVSVQDDGRGFSEEHAVSGRGLINMRYRAAQIGGELRVESTVEGTRVALAIGL